MTRDEILELMALKGWTRPRLASELDLSDNAVFRWLNGERTPTGPAAILMRLWLVEARAQATAAQAG